MGASKKPRHCMACGHVHNEKLAKAEKAVVRAAVVWRKAITDHQKRMSMQTATSGLNAIEDLGVAVDRLTTSKRAER